MNWIMLVTAGLFEIVWAIGIKYTDGFTRLWPTAITLAAMLVSVVLLCPVYHRAKLPQDLNGASRNKFSRRTVPCPSLTSRSMDVMVRCVVYLVGIFLSNWHCWEVTRKSL